MILPFFVAFFCFILFFFRLLEIQQDVEKALCYAVRETAVIAHGKDEEWDGSATGEALFYARLKELDTPVEYVDRCWSGFTFSEVEGKEDAIALRVSYQVKHPLNLLGVWNYAFSQQAICHKWQGSESGSREGEEYFYVTEYGTVYHTTTECPYLDLSIERVPFGEVSARRNQSGQIYRGCEECGADHGEMVYLTKYGETYHSDISCRGLSRGIYRISREEAAGYPPCPRCAY